MKYKNWRHILLVILGFSMGVPSVCCAQNLPHDSLLYYASQAPSPEGSDTFNAVEYFQTITKDSADLVKLFVYWIAKNIEYDTDKLLSGDLTYTDVENTLETRKTMCQGYSELLCDMCYWADIECEVIRGFVKGYEYSGKPFDTPNHLWNAVYLENRWKIVDATWASGFLEKKGRKPRFVKKIREQYIFANPDSIILTHYPVDKKWQLNDCIISIREFYGKEFILN
ncbi:MAG TPA: transglutaminase domain-containing protein [Caldisericia bacterium]|nr:transglutaminase domain-containing protein [Caldisericia bacterium]